MLIVSTIWLMFDLSVSCVPRPCLYMLGSSSQPKCFACVNLAYIRCMWTLESITPDHHVVLRNNEPSQRCTVRGNTSLEIFSEGSSYLCYRRSKQIRCKHDKHHMQIIKWHDMTNIILRLLISIFKARHDHLRHLNDTLISIIVSSWSCLTNYYFYYYG